MAEIDTSISELISQLKKLKGEGGVTREGSGASINVEESEEVRRIQEQINALYDDRERKNSRELEQAHDKVSLAKERLKELKKGFDATKELTDAQKEQLVTLADQVNKAQEFVNTLREANTAVDDLSGSFANIFGGPGAVKIEDVFSPKAIGGAISGLSKIAKTQKLSALASESATKAGSMFLETIVKTSMALADGEANFMKATGASKDFARSVTESYETTREFGATMEETSAAYQTLFTTFTDFTMLSKNQRKSIAETSTLMAKLGISNEDFAKSIQISTKAMGMSSAQAGQNMEDLAGFAQQLGVAPQQLAADFAGAGDMLAKMGQDGTKAFKDLAIVAKTTGMKMESILAITNKFDTFEGAAGQAGKLNAALGGNFVNAMDLMMATDPAERFGMIRDSILDAGLSFDEMSYYQRTIQRRLQHLLSTLRSMSKQKPYLEDQQSRL